MPEVSDLVSCRLVINMMLDKNLKLCASLSFIMQGALTCQLFAVAPGCFEAKATFSQKLEKGKPGWKELEGSLRSWSQHDQESPLADWARRWAVYKKFIPKVVCLIFRMGSVPYSIGIYAPGMGLLG